MNLWQFAQLGYISVLRVDSVDATEHHVDNESIDTFVRKKDSQHGLFKQEQRIYSD
jgi:hypothetical protein